VIFSHFPYFGLPVTKVASLCAVKHKKSASLKGVTVCWIIHHIYDYSGIYEYGCLAFSHLSCQFMAQSFYGLPDTRL